MTLSESYLQACVRPGKYKEIGKAAYRDTLVRRPVCIPRHTPVLYMLDNKNLLHSYRHPTTLGSSSVAEVFPIYPSDFSLALAKSYVRLDVVRHDATFTYI